MAVLLLCNLLYVKFYLPRKEPELLDADSLSLAKEEEANGYSTFHDENNEGETPN